MLAFSRVAAVATGRAVVRATNSGVTCAFGPGGEELARLRVGGRDRSVAGSLGLAVPVPVEGQAGERTPYVLLRTPLRLLLGLALAGLLWASRHRPPANLAGGR